MGLKKELNEFHTNIRILLEYVNEDNYLKRLIGKKTLDEYKYLEKQLLEFKEKVDSLSAQDKKLLELNVPLKMLAFYIQRNIQEIQSGKIENKKQLAYGLSFITKFISQVKDEYVHRIQDKVKKSDRELLLLLNQYTRIVYESRFKKIYSKLGYTRPFFDKFYRDYNLHGIPNKLLSEMNSIALHNSYDLYVCVLKGGLPYIILLELLGVPHSKIRYIFCGRMYTKNSMNEMMIGPVEFELEEFAGKNILLIDNNLGTGKSVKEAMKEIKRYNPASVSLFLDYILTDMAGITTKNLNAVIEYDLQNHHIADLRKDLLKEEELEKKKLSLIRKLKRRM